METKDLLIALWNKGVRGIKITWSCGGDDGSIEEVELLPAIKDYGDLTDLVRDLGWDVYTKFDGRTDGNFYNNGFVEIVILPKGKYYARLDNYYEDQNESSTYDEKTGTHEENEDYEPEHTVENITL